MTPQRIDLKTAPEEQLLLIHEFLNARRAEILPDDPQIPSQERLLNWRETHKHELKRAFVMLQDNQVVGLAEANWRSDDTDNPDLGWLDLHIAPVFQRQGYGSRLLLALLEEIAPLGRKKLGVSTFSTRLGAKPFAAYIGAKFGQEVHTNQLLFADLNREYLQKSLENPPRDVFGLVWYENCLPDDETELQCICDAFNILNTAPHGELELNDSNETPQKMRDWFANVQKEENQLILCLAQHLETGKYVGLTKTAWHRNRPFMVEQWGTGVDIAYRGQRLGAWLKAAMLERIFLRYPTVDRIRTENADSNAPMLKINHALGFKPFLERTEWQIDVEKALGILRQKAKGEGQR